MLFHTTAYHLVYIMGHQGFCSFFWQTNAGCSPLSYFAIQHGTSVSKRERKKMYSQNKNCGTRCIFS